MKKIYLKLSVFLIAIITISSCATSENTNENTISKTAPKLTASTITKTSYNSAAINSYITSDGGDPVTARGIVWNTSSSPTIALKTKTNEGSDIGGFTSLVNNLIPSSTYFIRAYATNSIGTEYSNELSFTGEIVKPTVSTTAITNITTNSAVSGGNITSDGGAPITARGIVWSTTQNPTIALTTKTSDGTGLGSFVSNLSNLVQNKAYYVRAYATNSSGTNYGAEIQFNTNQITTVSDIDGNVYPLSVDKIHCPQINGSYVCWSGPVYSTKNLNVTRYTDGTIIPQITDPTEWINLKTGAWCYYNNDSANGATYGKLYNWYAVMGIYDAASFSNPSLRKQLVPKGYQIPTLDQLEVLIKYGYARKESGTTHWLSPNLALNTGDSIYRFRLLPGGERAYYYGGFELINKRGTWWSRSEYPSEFNNIYAYILYATYDNFYFKTDFRDKKSGYSVIFIQE